VKVIPHSINERVFYGNSVSSIHKVGGGDKCRVMCRDLLTASQYLSPWSCVMRCRLVGLAIIGAYPPVRGKQELLSSPLQLHPENH